MQQHAEAARKERREALRVAKGLNKFIALPHRVNWKVHQEDVLQRGRPLTFFRTKRCFLVPDAISSLKERWVTVTRHGYMVVYEDAELGLLIDLRTALNVLCTADRYKTLSGARPMRCHIKIRLPRGNVHLFVRHEDVHKWTCAVMNACSIDRSAPIQKTSEDVHTAIEPRIVPNGLENFDDEQSAVSSSLCSSPKVTVIENLHTAEPLEPEHDTSSVPEPVTTISVRLLRRKLEKELVMRTKEEVLAEQSRRPPTFVSELFFESPKKAAPAPSVLSEQTVVLTPAEQSNRKREWWTRSLRC